MSFHKQHPLDWWAFNRPLAGVQGHACNLFSSAAYRSRGSVRREMQHNPPFPSCINCLILSAASLTAEWLCLLFCSHHRFISHSITEQLLWALSCRSSATRISFPAFIIAKPFPPHLLLSSWRNHFHLISCFHHSETISTSSPAFFIAEPFPTHLLLSS